MERNAELFYMTSKICYLKKFLTIIRQKRSYPWKCGIGAKNWVMAFYKMLPRYQKLLLALLVIRWYNRNKEGSIKPVIKKS